MQISGLNRAGKLQNTAIKDNKFKFLAERFQRLVDEAVRIEHLQMDRVDHFSFHLQFHSRNRPFRNFFFLFRAAHNLSVFAVDSQRDVAAAVHRLLRSARRHARCWKVGAAGQVFVFEFHS